MRRLASNDDGTLSLAFCRHAVTNAFELPEQRSKDSQTAPIGFGPSDRQVRRRIETLADSFLCASVLVHPFANERMRIGEGSRDPDRLGGGQRRVNSRLELGVAGRRRLRQ